MPGNEELHERPADGDDLPFLWDLHVTTMKEYVELTWGWDEAFQTDYFARAFESAHIRILMLDGRPIGAVETQLHPGHLFLTGIAILPSHQNRGIGGRVMEALRGEAVERRLPLRLQVLKVNPARRLYERLGFIADGETATHILMSQPPPSGIPG